MHIELNRFSNLLLPKPVCAQGDWLYESTPESYYLRKTAEAQ